MVFTCPSKKQKLKEWKFTLERLENSQKHSYHNYDNISNKLEQMLLQLENKEKKNMCFYNCKYYTFAK